MGKNQAVQFATDDGTYSMIPFPDCTQEKGWMRYFQLAHYNIKMNSP